MPSIKLLALNMVVCALRRTVSAVVHVMRAYDNQHCEHPLNAAHLESRKLHTLPLLAVHAERVVAGDQLQ
jgi:hypothetical protein